MHFIADEGVRLHVQVLGAGPPVVMLHGLLVGNMATWYWTAAPTLAKTHKVILFDLRGHGLSTRPPVGYDVDTMSRDLERVIEEFAGGKADVFGHSYGGSIALALTARAPHLVSKLAVVEAPLPASRLRELQGFLRASPAEMMASLPIELRGLVTGGGRRARRFLDTVSGLATETSLLADLEKNEDLSDEVLTSIIQPFLAVYGSRSSLRSVGDRLRRTVPHSELTEIDGGHFLPLEAPSRLTSILRSFIVG